MSRWKSRLHEIIFEADTPEGKAFDVVLLVAILLSVIAVMLESVAAIQLQYKGLFKVLEWVFTILFSIEYLLRVFLTKKPLKYIFSFFGLVDLLSILPSFVGFFIAGNTYSLVTIRSLRLLRVFRVLKLGRYVGGAQTIVTGLKESRPKITVFLVAVMSLAIIMGTLMYMIEGAENGFTSIPRSIYWAIVTLTTVGYGDIAPVTVLGQTIASALMILGYGIIAVPTGIVGAEIAKQEFKNLNTQVCQACSKEGHEDDAVYCKFCGASLDE